MKIDQIQQLDKQHIWHPCSQMKDYESFKPLIIHRAYDSYLELHDGRKIIDAISSWWCKSLGHNHPILKAALLKQLDQFEHVIFANTTFDVITQLSQRLADLVPALDKVFYANDGCCAVEIALKMSLHSRVIQGNHKRQQMIALRNGYHGETLGALSVSDVGLYRQPYNSFLFDTHFIDIPYLSDIDDATCHDCSNQWPAIEQQLAPYTETATAIIIEPIIQGAGGMRIYSKDLLNKLAQWALNHNVHLIVDEIMTGIGRTGKMLAIDHVNIQPDFVCLSKSLTSGWVPFSAVLTSNTIYQFFYDDYESGKAFLHSNTQCGNALAASVALATLEVIEKSHLCDRANQLQQIMMQNLLDIAQQTGKLHNIRGIGAIVAADLLDNNEVPRLGYAVYRKAIELGALLRPLGNTIYWLPPLTIQDQTLQKLKQITLQAINSIY